MNEIDITWINPLANSRFSELKGIDLQELIIRIEDFYLIYRESLEIDKRITFGFEIEYENLSRSEVDECISTSTFRGWDLGYDSTVDSGGEIRTPIMHDEKQYWIDLQKICKFLKDNKANTCGNAGGHIHVGTHILGNKLSYWQNFLLIYATYEHVIFRFLYGDKISHRAGIMEYARPIREIVLSNLSDFPTNIDKLITKFSKGKYQAVNFQHINVLNPNSVKNGNTIEFRSPNGTIEEVIWQNNANALIKLLLASSNSNLDVDYINYLLKKQGDISLVHYNEICLKDALEFVDIIFTNNLDKVYFLRQYLKSFENNYEIKGAVMARNFIKQT